MHHFIKKQIQTFIILQLERYGKYYYDNKSEFFLQDVDYRNISGLNKLGFY
jgi:hypothetical protein